MNIVDRLLENVALPRMLRVRQVFPDDALPDLDRALTEGLQAPEIAARVKPGMRIAVGVGSRGLAELPRLVRGVIGGLRAMGAQPFIVPAMGSHGGATAEGQRQLLASLGVTEASAGCEIRSSMDVVQVGTLDGGAAVMVDREAMQADGIVVINRVKPHTSFSGTHESGLVKMLTIGLGKQAGADACHGAGFGRMAQNIVEMARVKIARAPILFGVATVENAYDRIARVAVLAAERIVDDEPLLLAEARARMPRILFNPLDVLVVDRMGKEFSGTGMDPHITGRASTPYVSVSQQVARMVVLDLSDASHGNATGLGLADVCTRRLADKIDFAPTYANHITSTVIGHAKVPMTMASDLRALQVAVRTCSVPDVRQLRLVRVPDTLHLEHVRISEGLLDEARRHPQIQILGDPEPWPLDADGQLTDLVAPAHA